MLRLKEPILLIAYLMLAAVCNFLWSCLQNLILSNSHFHFILFLNPPLYFSGALYIFFHPL